MLCAGRGPVHLAQPSSLDLGERVVAFVLGARRCGAAAAAFDVSLASGVMWTQRARATGRAAAKGMGGKCPFLLGPQRGLLARLDKKPDLTLQARRADLRDRGIVFSYDTLWYVIREDIRRSNALFAFSVPWSTTTLRSPRESKFDSPT
jgi:transposase